MLISDLDYAKQTVNSVQGGRGQATTNASAIVYASGNIFAFGASGTFNYAGAGSAGISGNYFPARRG